MNDISVLSRRRRAGYVLGIALGVAHLSLLGVPTGGDDPGPPLAVLVVGAAIGLAVILLLVRSRHRDAGTARVVAGILLVVAALGAAPGLVAADVGLGLRVAAGLLVGLTVATLVLLFLPEHGAVRAEAAR